MQVLLLFSVQSDFHISIWEYLELESKYFPDMFKLSFIS